MNLRGLLLCALLAAMAAIGLTAFLVASHGETDTAEANGKVTICHRTNSVINPYRQIAVSESAVDGYEQSDHTHHIGSVATSQAVAQALKNAHQKWGDIIPPHPGNDLNWTAKGQAIYGNDCEYVRAPMPTPCANDEERQPDGSCKWIPPIEEPTPKPKPTPTPTPIATPEPTPAPATSGVAQPPSAPSAFPDTGGAPPDSR